MANMNIRTPRFYVDYVNFLKTRDSVSGHYGIQTGSSDDISLSSGSTIDELYDMRPLNQVEFNTTGNTNGHLKLWIDLKSEAFKVDFVAILNHNMVGADAKIRVSSDDHATDKAEIIAVNHAGASNKQAISNVVGGVTSDPADHLIGPDLTNSWGAGHTIINFTGVQDRFWGIQFEGTTNANDSSAGALFNPNTNLKIGCILIGQYYDMPHSPDLNVKRSIAFDGTKIQESLGGQRYSTITSHGRKNISDSNKSPFHTYYNAFGAYGGRMSYDMKFSYLNSTDIMPDNYNEFQPTDEGIIEDLWNKTNGNHTPFIFTQDGTSTNYSDYLFARFAQNSMSMTQVAPDVFDVAMKIEEEF